MTAPSFPRRIALLSLSSPPTDALAERLEAKLQAGDLPNLHAVLVAHGDRLVFERYLAGEDGRWGQPLGRIAFGPDVKHDLRSASKSIVGLLYGIALEKSLVPNLEQPLLAQFPAYEDLAADPLRQRMTVAHALTMTLGLEWSEDLPYSDPRNAEIAMDLADDRYRFVLERPFAADPGEVWTYSGGATALLAHLIARGCGKPLLQVAKEWLFEPLGIEDVEWVLGSNGEAAAASGLRMRGRDLAKIGRLVLARGRWDGRQLVPAAWLESSFEVHADTGEDFAYGYHWWLGRLESAGQLWVAACGNGGQRLTVIPSLDLVIVVLAGNYNKPGAWNVPVSVMVDVVLPALEG